MNHLETVKAIVAKVLEIDLEEVDEVVPFAESTKFKFDSIVGLDVLTELERKYKVKIGEKYLVKMTSVKQTVAVLEEILARA